MVGSIFHIRDIQRNVLPKFIQTVHSPLFFRKITEIERFALRAVIFHECQNYLGLFTVLYFPVRSSRSRALRYGLPSSMKKQGTVNSLKFIELCPSEGHQYGGRKPNRNICYRLINIKTILAYNTITVRIAKSSKTIHLFNLHDS